MFRRPGHRMHRRSIGGGEGAGGAPPAVTPADFGTLEAWIDPRYLITHSGDGTAVTAWTDSSAHAHAGTIIGAPTYEAAGWDGQPSVLFNGTDAAAAFDGVAAFASGTDVPVYVVMALQNVTAITNPRRVFSFGHSSLVETSRMHSLHQLTSDRYVTSRRDDAFVQKVRSSVASAASLNRAHIREEFNGALVSLYINGVVDVNISGGDLDVGACTFNRFAIACGRGSTNANFGNIRVGPVLVYSALTDAAGLEAWLASEGYDHA